MSGVVETGGRCLRLLGIHSQDPNLPFSSDDSTAGSETELQAAVVGERASVDLPRMIEESNYYAHLIRRAQAGDTPRKALIDLERFPESDSRRVWENSWVRFARRLLGPAAQRVLGKNLRADRSNSRSRRRSDEQGFLFWQNGEEMVRVPISYLVKLSLAEFAQPGGLVSPLVCRTAKRLLEHFLSDNTSPDTTSFHISPLSPSLGNGRAAGREASRRFLLTHLLVEHAPSSIASFRAFASLREIQILSARREPGNDQIDDQRIDPDQHRLQFDVEAACVEQLGAGDEVAAQQFGDDDQDPSGGNADCDIASILLHGEPLAAEIQTFLH